ncbi:MAG: hypothetical protein KAJ78_00595, partial [Acidobacteria bacterium]|nr:hypothetical protein [Acidobacteriota bacterium]
AGAPVATALGMRPVVVFSHGLTQGYPGQNTPLFEELASNGTVVFSIAHTYETLAVEMPDGRLLPWDKDLEASFVENIRAFKPIHQKLLVDYEGRPLPSDGLRGLFDLTPVISRSMAVWAADISSVIDEIERMSVENQTEGLGVILDPSKMAAAGMSFGGTASAQAAFSDERIRAVVNLDGFHYGDALLGKRVSVPYLLFGSNVSQRWRNNYVLEDGPSTSYWVVLAEAKHFDFSDFVFFGDVFRWLRALGPIGEARMPGLISAFVVPFLDGVFENQGPADLDSLTEKWPEAQVTKFPLSESDDSLFQP